MLIACQSIMAQATDSVKTIVADTLMTNTAMVLPPSNQAIKSPIKYEAKDSMVFDLEAKMVYLYGVAKVEYEDIVLNANFIRIDQAQNIVYAIGTPDSTGKVIGKPVFKQGADEYKSEEISYNFKTKKGKIKSITTQEGDGFLYASQVKKNERDEFFIKNGRYSTCNLDHPHYYIAISKAKRAKNTIVAGPSYLVIEDVPVPLGIPFGFFPRTEGRSSGILLPTVGEDRALGFYLRDGGYYFGLSDYWDAQIRAGIYTKGSYSASLATRYKYLYHYSGNVNFSYNNRKIGEPETAAYSVNKDFRIGWTHLQDNKTNPTSNFSASVNAGTSSFYRNFSTTDINSRVNNQLTSSTNYSKQFKGTPFSLSSQLTHSQNTNTRDITLGLPSISFNMNRIQPFENKKRIGPPKFYEKIGISYSSRFENTISTKDSLIFKKSSLKNFRNGVSHNIPISASYNILKYFQLSPSINYQEFWYFKTIRKSYDPEFVLNTDTVSGFERANTYNFGTGLSTNVFGMYNVNALGIKAIRHVVKPSVGFTYTPDFSAAKYGYYKNLSDSLNRLSKYSIFEQGIFSGPGTGKSGLVSFGVSNNIEMKVANKKDTVTGTKKVALFDDISVRGNYNLLADSLNFSNISFSARNRLLGIFDITYQSTIDPYVRYKTTSGQVIRVNRFLIEDKNKIGTLTNATLSVSTSLNANTFKKTSATPQKLDRNRYNAFEFEEVIRNRAAFVDFAIPYTLSASYYITVNPLATTQKATQSLNFNGDVNVTKLWKVGFFSGYDFKVKKLTSTSLSIYRDLHCWDFSATWIPFGTYRSYNVSIKVKASILQDLKLNRRREFYETF